MKTGGKKRKMAPRRVFRRMVLVAIVLAVIAVCVAAKRVSAMGDVATDEQIRSQIDALRVVQVFEPVEETETSEEEPELSEDVVLLARIMQEEDGIDWPDAMIMCIGEVVLNRVDSPDYPDTVRGVLYQIDCGYVQYAPVYAPGWESIEPQKKYVELAERLLDGERVLDDGRVVYQALFEQGEGAVLAYHDVSLGSTTYFCLTEGPGTRT